jgi:calcium-dependent protein kinase
MCERGGNLANKNFNEQQSAEVTRKVLSALQYMHSKGVTHRDIKLENIMIDRSGEVKLIDFGLATKYQSEEYANLTDTVGTLYSMAPEVLEGTYYDNKADLWSVGVVAYLLLSKKQPFWGPAEPMAWPIRRRVMMDLILKGQYAPMDGEAWVAISHVAIYFVESLLQYNPNDRPTASVALESQWVRAYAMVSGMTLENNPESRTRNVDQTEVMKTLRRVSNCRRRAWRILTIKFSFPKIEQLETRLSVTDTTGQGYVGADDLLHHIQEVGQSLLSEEDINALKRDILLVGTDFQIEYIDFITEVKRGRKRNIMDRLSTVLDETDNLGQVKLSSLMELVDKDVIPDELREEFRQTVLFLCDFHGRDGTISTLHILDFMEKRLAHRETKGVVCEHT